VKRWQRTHPSGHCATLAQLVEAVINAKTADIHTNLRCGNSSLHHMIFNKKGKAERLIISERLNKNLTKLPTAISTNKSPEICADILW
jgi:hypothetical protein